MSYILHQSLAQAEAASVRQVIDPRLPSLAMALLGRCGLIWLEK